MMPLLLAAFLFAPQTYAPTLLGTHTPTLARTHAPTSPRSHESAQEWMQPVDNPRTEPLWPDGAPGALGTEEQDEPTLTIYLPFGPQATGAGIVICPGGGYQGLAMDHEGHQVARWFTARGVAAFIVKYRLGPRYHHPAMLQDALRAIRVVRSRASEFGVEPDRIGVLGFSAGGHLASSAATLFDHPDGRVTDGLNATTSRPDFAILAYPVIAFGQEATHRGSQEHLLGESPTPELVARLSTERQVTTGTPPTFLFHTTEDSAVPPENSVQFYLALRKAGVAAELHIYEKGRHGVGLAPHDPVLATWPELALAWLKSRGFLKQQ
jgi:acetyl esterase/lipase